MRVLVTGGAGFLGRRICRELSSADHDVCILARSDTAAAQGEHLGFPVKRADVTDAVSVESAVQGFDWVVHAAADLNYWRQDPARQMRVNVEGTRTVARACLRAGVKRLLHVSSVGAIGIPPDAGHPAGETFAFNLNGTALTYHISKHRAEAAALEPGLDAVIVNPASITGPERLSGLLENVRRHRVVPCFSGGNCVVDAADAAAGIRSALERGRTGERYILGGENLTFQAMAEKAAANLKLSRSFFRIPPLVTAAAAAVCEPWARYRKRPPKFAYMIHYCANRFLYYDSAKARRELDYHPRDFESILELR